MTEATKTWLREADIQHVHQFIDQLRAREVKTWEALCGFAGLPDSSGKWNAKANHRMAVDDLHEACKIFNERW